VKLVTTNITYEHEEPSVLSQFSMTDSKQGYEELQLSSKSAPHFYQKFS